MRLVCLFITQFNKVVFGFVKRYTLLLKFAVVKFYFSNVKDVVLFLTVTFINKIDFCISQSVQPPNSGNRYK